MSEFRKWHDHRGQMTTRLSEPFTADQFADALDATAHTDTKYVQLLLDHNRLLAKSNADLEERVKTLEGLNGEMMKLILNCTTGPYYKTNDRSVWYYSTSGGDVYNDSPLYSHLASAKGDK